MALIWRCAAQAAKDSLRHRVPIQEVLKNTGNGWQIPAGVEVPDDLTAKELAEWIRNMARPCDI